MRSFLALPLGPRAVRSAIAVQHAWRLDGPEGTVNWVRPENFHVTLRFLGQIPDHLVEPIAGALAEAAARTEPVVVRLDRAASLGGRGRPAVLVLEGEAQAGLGALVIDLDAQLAHLGLAPRDHPFRAHLTLGRARRQGAASALPAPADPIDWIADRAVLYQSLTDKGGSRYVALREVLLGGGEITRARAREED